MQDVENVVSSTAFWVALALGAAGTVVVMLRSQRGHREPGIALVAIVACLVGLRVDHRLPAPLIVGLALLVVGEWMTRDQRIVASAVGAVPGALVLGVALPDHWPSWIRVVVVASAVVGGVLVDAAQRVIPRLAWLLVAISAAGMYLCVPDTESLPALLGASLACAFVAIGPRLEPSLGAIAFTGLFVWIAGVGGVGRPGSVVGGIACLGVLLLGPLVRQRTHPVVLVATQLALVLFVSRVAGFEDSRWAALLLCVPAFACAALVLVATTRRSRQP